MIENKKEFKLIAKLNGMYLPAHYPFRMKGVEQGYVLAKDFDERIDVARPGWLDETIDPARPG